MEKKNSFLKDFIEVVVTVFVINFIVTKFIAMPCVVNGNSMYPTLDEGDRCYSAIFSKNNIERFDIVVIDLHSANNKKLVKRVVGLPNETIEYKDNKLFVNGNYIEEEFTTDERTKDFIVTLGEDEYYCLGDNRHISKDSRYYGAFHSKDIMSKDIFVIYPFKNFGVKK